MIWLNMPCGTKCTHGLTQNANKCLNEVIWDRSSTYEVQEIVALATYLAVLKFNEGDISFLKILKILDSSLVKVPKTATKRGSSYRPKRAQER